MIETVARFLGGKLKHGIRGLRFESSEAEKLFQARLQQKKLWCSEKLNECDPAGSLRSEFLKPSFVAINQWTYGLIDPVLEVERLCEKRASAITSFETGNRFSGRLLLFWPEESLVCGAAEQTSKGYFDVWNAPP